MKNGGKVFAMENIKYFKDFQIFQFFKNIVANFKDLFHGNRQEINNINGLNECFKFIVRSILNSIDNQMKFMRKQIENKIIKVIINRIVNQNINIIHYLLF